MITDWLEARHARRTFIKSMATAAGSLVIASALPGSTESILVTGSSLMPDLEGNHLHPAAKERYFRGEPLILGSAMLFMVDGSPLGRWNFPAVHIESGERLTLEWGNGVFRAWVGDYSL